MGCCPWVGGLIPSLPANSPVSLKLELPFLNGEAAVRFSHWALCVIRKVNIARITDLLKSFSFKLIKLFLISAPWNDSSKVEQGLLVS